MTTSINDSEMLSTKERKDIWGELQSLRRDTQAFRTDAYRLRTIDPGVLERLRTQQLDLERRGEAILKRLSPEFEWGSGRETVKANDDAIDAPQFWTPGGQTLLIGQNFLQLQDT